MEVTPRVDAVIDEYTTNPHHDFVGGKDERIVGVIVFEAGWEFGALQEAVFELFVVPA